MTERMKKSVPQKMLEERQISPIWEPSTSLSDLSIDRFLFSEIILFLLLFCATWEGFKLYLVHFFTGNRIIQRVKRDNCSFQLPIPVTMSGVMSLSETLSWPFLLYSNAVPQRSSGIPNCPIIIAKNRCWKFSQIKVRNLRSIWPFDQNKWERITSIILCSHHIFDLCPNIEWSWDKRRDLHAKCCTIHEFTTRNSGTRITVTKMKAHFSIVESYPRFFFFPTVS